ncbi:MAG: Ig-like domain-containing protein [Haliea sp.]|nr:Ig-like domain-containing protein [Haliea sp.]
MVDDRTPMILALNPPEGESGVGTNPYYAVRFDEAVSNFQGNAGLLGQTNNIQFSESNEVVRYERAGTLPANTAVTETLPTFSDHAGNAVAGSTTFTTGDGPDLDSGSVVTTSVPSGATGVAQNPVLVRAFSEPVDPVSVSDSGVYLYDSSTGLHVPASLDLSADGRRLTLVPVDALAPGRLYYWYAFSLRDLSGNSMSGPSYTFTTGFEEDSTGPLFEAATLFDGQTAVPTNVRVGVRFDEPLNPILTAGVQLQDEGGTAVTADISFSSDRRTVTVVPRSLLAPNSSYLLSVSGVQDISGNPLLVPVAMTFTTGDGLDNVQGGIVNWSYAQGCGTAIERGAGDCVERAH